MTDTLALATDPAWVPFAILELAMFFGFVHLLNKRRLALPGEVAGALLLAVLWSIAHMLRLNFVLDAAVNILLLAGFLLITRRATVSQIFYFACIFVLATEISKILALNFCLQPFRDQLILLPLWSVTCIYALLYYLFTALILVAVSRWALRDALENLHWQQILFILLPLLPYVFIRASSFVYDVTDESRYYTLSAVLLLLGVCTIAMIVANAHNLSVQTEHNEVLRMQTLLHEQHLLFLGQKSAMDAVNQRYHDLKHYLNWLESLLEDSSIEKTEQIAGFLESVRREIRPYEATVASGNETLDILLSEKYTLCAEQDIRPLFYVDGSRFGFMNSFDICAIFGNLLDNAIEAAIESRRWAPTAEDPNDIILHVYYNSGLAVINCTNRCQDVARSVADNPQAVRGTDAGHGYGFKSLRSIVERYNGGLTWSAEDGEFKLSIVIPLPMVEGEV